MSEKKFLDGYSGQTTRQLIDMEDEYRVDSLVLAFEEAIQKKEESLGTASLSPAERVILAVEALEREVNNGGYEQFFSNSSVEYSGDVVQALISIGCREQASIAQKALDTVIPSGSEIDAEAIEDLLMDADDQLLDALSECDDAFWSASESIEDSLFAYVKANQASITLPADAG